MKNILTLFIALLSFVAVSAQTQEHSITIDESSFVPESGLAIDKIGKDTSKRPCARIKLHINRMTRAEIEQLDVRPIGGSVVVMKQVVNYDGNGLIIELTAKEPTRFYLHHDKYGDSNEVSLNLEGDKEYKLSAQLNFTHSIVVSSNAVNVEVYLDGEYMGRTDDSFTLTVKDVTPGMHRLKVQSGVSVSEKDIEVSSASIHFRIEVNTTTALPQYVVLKVVPNDAVVMVDGKNYVLDADGVVTMTLQNGSYNYEVLADEFYTERGTFVVRGEKIVKRIELKPAHGWLSVDADASLVDASVYVDNKLVGKTPISRCRLASGTHHIRIVKEMYHTLETTINIEDGKELNYTPTLSADFATVTIDAGKDCDIYVNDARMGVSPWTGRLATGTYIFEARKDGCRSTLHTQSISAMPAKQSYKLNAPTPIMGMLNIVSTPAMAEIYVDGVLVGETPLMYNLLIGSHTIELRKQGFKVYKQSIRVEENNIVDIVATMTEHKDETYIETAKGLNLKMIYVEGGTFAMGSNSGESDEKSVHNVTLDSYYIGETEITQAQWRAVMGSNPSYYTGDNRPVECVSWNDAQEFCEKLSELTGKRYVLPTEAQWEYAARGGNQSKGYTYSGSNNIDEVAKYNSSACGGHSNVKSKKPNELGIYDMSGNVWEWCSDWYSSSSYSSSSQTNPQGPNSGSDRVLRGGSWGSNAGGCRVAFRHYGNPSGAGIGFGFRVVCLPDDATSTVMETNIKSYVETAKGINLNMIYVEGGTFAMGSNSGKSDEKPVHDVTLDSYYIGETEITQAQWRAVMGSNPSSYTGDNRPVESVSWNDAQEFCKKLSELTGKRYVLPTEAQWEYAARGGNQSKGYTYSGSSNIDEVAIYYSNSGSGHSKVKSKKPNELGIYDMSGNVWEWCSDWYGGYSSSSQPNPQGPSSGSDRVLRGGSWHGIASRCRVAYRHSYVPSITDHRYGFRVVCLP